MIILPDGIWTLLLQEFRRIRRRVEQVAYLDGVEAGALAVVTTITIPKAILRSTSFSVSPEAMSEAGQHFGTLTRIAQVHTHPEGWVDHSAFDDIQAYSRHEGATSLVIPNYAKSVLDFAEVGIHVFKDDHWKMLSQTESKEFIRSVPSFLDFRNRQAK